jgi:hypothetical protein
MGVLAVLGLAMSATSTTDLLLAWLYPIGAVIRQVINLAKLRELDIFVPRQTSSIKGEGIVILIQEMSMEP